ncbi:MAG TPA: regulatory iron-sulfur-containing complex subunit RicT [Gemmatimonadaceae bacterium]|nr:regulatory iron-sulfur-containing complex subunit RicT [Gemmatimonadaceae bacterium]
MAHLVEVAFKGNRKEFFLWDYPDPPPLKAAVIVDADRGEDLGYVHALGELAQKRSGGCAHGCGTAAPDRKALRLASQRDRTGAADLDRLNEEARQKAMERVRANGLAMKVSDAEWQWDKKKLTFYFTAEKRVDFRNLVRDLASLFRTRIELKQIGVRDEARRLDGVGRCGRQYCSASWLPELRPVNLGVAKDQRLSLNPAQISGACGRLMCCLRYEHEFYVQSRKRFPKEGKLLTTARGEEKLMSIDIFHERLTLRNAEGDVRVVPLADFNRERAALRGEIGAGTNAGDAVAALEHDDPEPSENGEDISLELLFASEQEAMPTVELIVEDAPRAAETSAMGAAEGTDAQPGATDDKASRRRRGRRGGRRGRGSDSGPQ